MNGEGENEVYAYGRNGIEETYRFWSYACPDGDIELCDNLGVDASMAVCEQPETKEKNESMHDRRGDQQSPCKVSISTVSCRPDPIAKPGQTRVRIVATN